MASYTLLFVTFSKGLGLSSLSGIVRQRKGFVQVNSSEGKGSESTTYFPAISYQDVAQEAGFGASQTKNLT